MVLFQRNYIYNLVEIHIVLLIEKNSGIVVKRRSLDAKPKQPLEFDFDRLIFTATGTGQPSSVASLRREEDSTDIFK